MRQLASGAAKLSPFKPLAGFALKLNHLDSGPSQITDKLLDTLEEKKVKAAFFVNGQNGMWSLESKPDQAWR